MANKRIIAAVVGAALLVGAVVSGCNRNRDASAAKSRRPVKTTPAVMSELAQASIARPAEVLAASVRRPARSRPAPAMRLARRRAQASMYRDYYQQPYPPAVLSPQSSAELARYEPLPEPVPVSELYRQDVQRGAQYANAPYGGAQSGDAYSYAFIRDARNAQPRAPAQINHSPELAMARAALTPVAIPPPAPAMPTMAETAARFSNFVVPPIEPNLFAAPAPIPELEPVRYQGAPPQTPRLPRLVPQISQLPARQPAAAKSWTQGWVPSPTMSSR